MSGSSTGTGSGASGRRWWEYFGLRAQIGRGELLALMGATAMVVLIAIIGTIKSTPSTTKVQQAAINEKVKTQVNSIVIPVLADIENASSQLDAKVAADKDLSNKIAAANEASLKAEKAAWEKERLQTTDAAAAERANKAWAEFAAATKAHQQLQSLAEAEATKAAHAATKAVNDAKKALEKVQDGAAGGFKINWGLLLLTLLLLSLFPLSAIAFWCLEVPFLQAQLKIDYEMLGSEPRVLPNTNWLGTDFITQRWNWFSYALHCGLTIFATVAGAALFFRQPDGILDVNTQRGMQLGFLGAYVYCLNLIYRRYTTRDLLPHVYLSCAVGLIVGMVFNFVAFTAIANVAAATTPADDEFTGVGAGVAAILAFSLGYFPNLAIRWFGRISRTSVHERQRRSDALPLAMIDGISELHESRLQDEGIDNMQNLAAVDIQDLVEKTPYNAQQIVEWVDQAVLYLYIDPGEIESFRKAGVRSVSDFRDIWAGFSVRYQLQADGTVKRIPAEGESFENRRRAIAQQLATTEQRLDCLFRATEEGANMDHVRTYWANVQTAATQTRKLLVNQVCGRVGRTLRESFRDGDTLAPIDILRQVAEELFKEVANCASDDQFEVTAESLYGQAYLKQELKEVAEARRLYIQCTENFPSDPAAYNDLAWLNLHTLTLKSDFKVAYKIARKAVYFAKRNGGFERDLAGYLDTLAVANIKLDKLKEAEKRVRQAIVTRPTDARLLNTLVRTAEAYFIKGDPASKVEAKRLLDEVDATPYANDEVKRRVTELRTKYTP